MNLNFTKYVNVSAAISCRCRTIAIGGSRTRNACRSRHCVRNDPGVPNIYEIPAIKLMLTIRNTMLQNKFVNILPHESIVCS